MPKWTSQQPVLYACICLQLFWCQPPSTYRCRHIHTYNTFTYVELQLMSTPHRKQYKTKPYVHVHKHNVSQTSRGAIPTSVNKAQNMLICMYTLYMCGDTHLAFGPETQSLSSQWLHFPPTHHEHHRASLPHQ